MKFARARRLLGRLGRAAAARPDLCLAAVASVVIIIITSRVWGPVHSVAGDDLHHLAAERVVYGTMAEGGDPMGPLAIDNGVPLLRFYQPLFYVTTSALTLATGMDRLILHNAVVIICFVLSPWILAWGLRCVGLDPWAAGLAALVGVCSVAGFGNSFDAYFRPGIITQAMSYVFFVPFLATFYRLLEGKGGPVKPAVFLALSMLSHAPLAVFVILAGAVLFFSDVWPLRQIWKRLAVFVVLASTLVGFWILPLISYQSRYRAVPDPVLRKSRGWLWNGLTADDTARLLVTGRLFDDGRSLKKEKHRHALDKLIDKANMSSTRWVRFPILTIFILGGFLFSLFRLRRRAYRFFAATFGLGLLFYIGPDEVPWLDAIPFASRIQGFRSTVLVEFCGLALGGLAVSALGHAVWERRDRIVGLWKRRGFTVVFALVVAGLLGGTTWMAWKTGAVSVRKWKNTAHQRLVDAAEPARDSYPLRIMDAYAKRDTRRRSFLAHRGMQSTCGHFLGLEPQSMMLLCRSLKPVKQRMALITRLGFGHIMSAGKVGKEMEDIKLGKGKKALEKIHVQSGHHLYRIPGAHFLQPMAKAALFVASEPHWLYVTRSWTKALKRRTGDAVLPVLADEEIWRDDALLGTFHAIYVLNPDLLPDHALDPLVAYKKEGGTVYSTREIDGVETERLEGGKNNISSGLRLRSSPSIPVVDEPPPHRYIQGPFAATVTMPGPGWVMMPLQHMPGWHAEVDGEPVMTAPAGPDLVAAPVPQGEHRIEFYWERPARETALLAVAGVGWVGVLAWGLFCLVAWWRRRGEA